jgi:hypothetical protein
LTAALALVADMSARRVESDAMRAAYRACVASMFEMGRTQEDINELDECLRIDMDKEGAGCPRPFATPYLERRELWFSWFKEVAGKPSSAKGINERIRARIESMAIPPAIAKFL